MCINTHSFTEYLYSFAYIIQEYNVWLYYI